MTDIKIPEEVRNRVIIMAQNEISYDPTIYRQTTLNLMTSDGNSALVDLVNRQSNHSRRDGKLGFELGFDIAYQMLHSMFSEVGVEVPVIAEHDISEYFTKVCGANFRGKQVAMNDRLTENGLYKATNDPSAMMELYNSGIQVTARDGIRLDLRDTMSMNDGAQLVYRLMTLKYAGALGNSV
jgi:hypothetical protein